MQPPTSQQIVRANGVELCVETYGDRSDPPLVLIGGASASMDWWRPAFCGRLAQGGLRVIRYDQRDTGQSTSSKPGAPGYSGPDLVADAIALLDALGIAKAHVAGISMGGGMGQLLAVEHADRVASLTLMSTSPDAGPDLPPPTEAIMAGFENPPPPPDWSKRDAVIDHIVESHRPYAGSLGFDEDEVRAVAAAVVDRTIDIEASMTNHWLLEGGAAVRPRLGTITAPTLVIHGTDDPMFPLAHGQALAREIPGARLLAVEGMGHEVPPPPAWDEVVAAILEHTRA